MPNKQSPTFISHASTDDAFVKELRIKLEQHGLNIWVDSRNLPGGDKLSPEIKQAIRTARHFIVVLSPNTINSAWVRQEIQLAEQVAQEKQDYRMIPLLLPGIEPAALGLWFKEEPVGVPIQLEPGQLQENIADILAALGERQPDDASTPPEVSTKPVAELLLQLEEPKLTQQEDGTFQLSCKAKLEYIPTDSQAQPSVKSKPFRFISPIGQIEQDDLRWYLERYHSWPTGLFRKRAEAIEAKLPQWGKKLFAATLGHAACRDVLSGWQQTRDQVERRVSIYVDDALLQDTDEDKQEQSKALQAASKLLGLPWELLHDGKVYLSDATHPASIRRRLPNYENHLPMVMQLPIRILLLSPRPEQHDVGYIDHRASALPLVEAVESLGNLVELTVLTPATLMALQNELKRAKDANKPYHVLHFDGHGIYDTKHGLGALCFEDPQDSEQLQQRRMQLVYAKQGDDDQHPHNMASLLRDYRIPLVFLEACQTAQSEADPNASVAASLLQEGVVSVIAMSHSVLVETARRFVEQFYQSLARGQRIGQAMLDGQNALMHHSFRLRILGAGELHMRDWFVPILYQEQYDPQLFARIPSERTKETQKTQQDNRLGKLPKTPEHSFIGRSRDLLTLERMLLQQSKVNTTTARYAVIRGQGGIGKTTLAIELAHWLVHSCRFDRCAFVSLEEYSHDRAVLDELGRQLCGNDYTVAEYGDDRKKALQPLQRVLKNESCLIVLDNLETLLANEAAVQPLLQLATDLLASDTKTRLLFTTREPLPAPFNHDPRECRLGALALDDAKELVMRVMANAGLNLKHDDDGKTPQEVDNLVNAVQCHPRALVLLAQELSRKGVTATTQNLHNIMLDLERRYPGQRELSLFASVELSLQRLSIETRELIKGLAVLHDGGNVSTIMHVLDIEQEGATELCRELIQVGLAQEKDYNYLRLDPALPHYLSLSLTAQDKEIYQQRWLSIMEQLVDFLYQQLFKDTKLSFQLTQLELPNLMAYLAALINLMQTEQVTAEQVAGQAGRIEQLLANLNYPQALAEAVRIREQASEQFKQWSHAQFETEKLTIERLLSQNDLQASLAAAQKLLQNCQQAGTDAYTGADYDFAIANSLLGRVLETSGAATKALPYLQQAQYGFEALGETGSRMASVSLAEQGDCFAALGMLDEAVTVYQEGIKRSKKLNDTRGLAVKKIQLASVYILQKDYQAALQGFHEALALFQQLNEPGATAVVWHQIGITHSEQGQFEPAESAYRKSLAIKTKQQNRSGEASSLGELASLYKAWNRPEQAVDYYRQAADIYTQLGDQRCEGSVRNNLAHTLIKLNFLDEARTELLRAIDCKKPFGHAAQPWTTWAILYDMEQANGNPSAADAACQQAITAYLAYRRDGGENHSGTGRLCLDVLQAIQQQDTEKVEQAILQLLEQEGWQKYKTYLHTLQAILTGDRNPTLAEDETMDYDDVAELKWLLEQLAG